MLERIFVTSCNVGQCQTSGFTRYGFADGFVFTRNKDKIIHVCEDCAKFLINHGAEIDKENPKKLIIKPNTFSILSRDKTLEGVAPVSKPMVAIEAKKIKDYFRNDSHCHRHLDNLIKNI